MGRNGALMRILVAALITALYFYGGDATFYVSYIALFLFVSIRALQSASRKRSRAFLIVAYAMVLAMQLAFYHNAAAGHEFWTDIPLRRLFAVASLALPMAINRYLTVSTGAELYMPTLHETLTISFSQLRELRGSAVHAMVTVRQAGGRLTPHNFKELLLEMPRHDVFRYINSGSLTDEYFRDVEATLGEPYLYIIISNTGTPASEVISAFTNRQFNHASIAFDAGLRTIISYNGGERVYPPGMNREMVEYFNKKPGASILVYRLAVTREQKEAALATIARINAEGSAYNLIGLFTNRSHKPNIMYCSQFVYGLLEEIGVSLFKSDGVVKPTDLIERDYTRKLEFVEELRLN